MDDRSGWIVYRGMVVVDASPSMLPTVDQMDARRILFEYKGWMVRWHDGWDCETETPYWYVIKDNFGGMEELRSKHRTEVRKGLLNFDVRPIGKEVLIKEGFPVYSAAVEKYGNGIGVKPLSSREFAKEINAKNAPEWEFFGVFHKETGCLVAYSQNRIYEDSVEYKNIKFNPHFLKQMPSEALFYVMNEYYLAGCGFKFVNDGVRALLHDTSIQDYLMRKFNFRKAYCRLRIYYHPVLKAVISGLYPFRSLLIRAGRGRLFGVVRPFGVLLYMEEIRKRCSSLEQS